MICERRESTIDLVCQLASMHPGISVVQLFYVTFPPPVTRESLDPTGAPLFDTAISLRRAHELGFWDALLRAAREVGQIEPAIVKRLLLHNAHPSFLQLTADSTLRARLQELLAGTTLTKALVLASEVLVDNSSPMHIPMLDFAWPAGPRAEELIATLLAASSWRGWLLSSGKSYHFIGSQLLTQDGLVSFLGSALLLGDAVDRRWLGHQLLERRCGLRISARSEYGASPQVVRQI